MNRQAIVRRECGIARCGSTEESTDIRPMNSVNRPIAKATITTKTMTTSTKTETKVRTMKNMITIRKNLKGVECNV